MKKAVIDMGTNSTRLAVAAWNGENLDMVCNEVAETRLGEGMGEVGQIQPVPLAHNVEAVQRFVQKARALGAAEVRITATSAVRDAVDQEIVRASYRPGCRYTVGGVAWYRRGAAQLFGRQRRFFAFGAAFGRAGYWRRQHGTGLSGVGRRSWC